MLVSATFRKIILKMFYKYEEYLVFLGLVIFFYFFFAIISQCMVCEKKLKEFGKKSRIWDKNSTSR